MKKLLLILVAFAAITACSHHDHDDPAAAAEHAHASDAGRETTAVTIYSDDHEVFTEYELLVPGEESHFLIHVTTLDEDYSAFSDGLVEVALETNGHRQQGNAEADDVPGIFHFNITPERAGDARIDFLVISENRTDSLSCHAHVYGGQDDHRHVEEASSAGLIKYTKEQAWKQRFNVMKVEPQPFSEVIRASGEFLAVPGEKQFVTAKAEGVVLFSSKNLVQGIFVEKGQELFILSSQGLADNNLTTRYNMARTDFEKSKSDLARHRALFRENIISDKQYLETESRYINDSIRYYSLKGSFSGNGMKVVSPIDGYLHELNVSEGQFVKPGDLLVTVSSNKVMLLRADVPQQHYGKLGSITSTHFRPAYTEKVYTLDELSGKLLSRGASVAENNHYLPVYFEVVNDGTLLEGAFAEYFLKTDPLPEQMVIPVSALIEEQGNYYVYVQVSGEAFEKRPVTLRANDGIHASVASGLQFGERIVSEGSMLIKTAASGSMPSHNHSH